VRFGFWGAEYVEELARVVAGQARFHLISKGRHTFYRIWQPEDTTVLKIYGSESVWRREKRAIESLTGVKGLPRILNAGTIEGTTWVEFADAGRWTLDSMPENRHMARQAGEILRSVHQADPGALSKLGGGMDQAWIESDYSSTFERIGRYRRRLKLPAELIERAKAAPRPLASEPRAAHARPHPRKFVVSDGGEVTLIDWAWSRLAPPEWDFSEAVWLCKIRVGAEAAQAMSDGYGKTMTDDAMAAWTVYHAGMMLLHEAETRAGPLDDLNYIVDQIAAMI